MGQENTAVRENSRHLEMKRRMANILQMHSAISRITDNNNRTCLEYLDEFSALISQFIIKLEIFPYHFIWECITQEAGGNVPIEDPVILLDMTNKEYRQSFLTGTDFFNYGKDRYHRIPLGKEEFNERCLQYFEKGTLEKLFPILVKRGYDYFHLPIFPGNETMPRWIITLIYHENDSQMVAGEEFSLFMEQLSHEIGMTWDRFQENVVAQLMERINYQIAWGKKTESDSGIDQLRIITSVLARQLQVEWCGIFLENKPDNMLNLEAANMGHDLPPGVSLKHLDGGFADSFKQNKIYRLLGRENLEEAIKPGIMKPFEKAIRKEKKQRNFKRNKHFFTPYVLFEHALFYPIDSGGRKPGIISLFRAKNSREPEPSPEKKFPYETRPFSVFETYLLKRVQQEIAYVLIAYDAVQKKMRDTRNMIAQVVSPISALISSTRKYAGKAHFEESIATGKLSETLDYIHSLSIVANQYLNNFETLLDIDTRCLVPRLETIPDLRKFLIDISRLYLPLCRKKFIHINVTAQTPSDISLEVDSDLFEIVISNLIDNAVKYSFYPEERLKHGLQDKPATMADKENILITAREDEHSVTITISNYGIEIPEADRGKIFERDFRGTYAPEGGKGSGIGLFLAKQIIALHEGTLELVPGTPPHNTVFKITLPRGRKEKDG
ncbi:MAG: HAMP domain-containing histidine kinase [Acidobacteria bacterium]|nr:HAMP domain-containing histidine kinase [Acidobacteriota bacterium]